MKKIKSTLILNNEIISPCKGICKMNTENRYCIGCYRTLHEISQWSMYTSSEKTAVLKKYQRGKRFNLELDETEELSIITS